MNFENRVTDTVECGESYEQGMDNLPFSGLTAEIISEKKDELKTQLGSVISSLFTGENKNAPDQDQAIDYLLNFDRFDFDNLSTEQKDSIPYQGMIYSLEAENLLGKEDMVLLDTIKDSNGTLTLFQELRKVYLALLHANIEWENINNIHGELDGLDKEYQQCLSDADENN